MEQETNIILGDENMKKYLKMTAFVIVYIVLPLVLNLLVIKIITGIAPIDEMRKTTPTSMFMITDPISIIALFLLVKYIRKEKPLQFANFKKITLQNALLSVAIGVILAMVTNSVTNIAAIKDSVAPIAGSISWIIGGNVFLVLFTAIINNIYKEFCFRGLAFNEMRKNLPLAVAMIIQAMFYAAELMYFQNPASVIIYAFLGQLAFGIVFYLGRSIFSSILSQVFCTTALVIIDRTAVKGIFTAQSSVFLLIFCILAVIALIVLLNGAAKGKMAGESTAA